MTDRALYAEVAIKHLRSLADMIESGSVEVLNAAAYTNPKHEVQTMGACRIDGPCNNTYSTLCTIRVEFKRK